MNVDLLSVRPDLYAVEQREESMLLFPEVSQSENSGLLDRAALKRQELKRLAGCTNSQYKMKKEFLNL